MAKLCVISSCDDTGKQLCRCLENEYGWKAFLIADKLKTCMASATLSVGAPIDFWTPNEHNQGVQRVLLKAFSAVLNTHDKTAVSRTITCAVDQYVTDCEGVHVPKVVIGDVKNYYELRVFKQYALDHGLEFRHVHADKTDMAMGHSPEMLIELLSAERPDEWHYACLETLQSFIDHVY